MSGGVCFYIKSKSVQCNGTSGFRIKRRGKGQFGARLLLEFNSNISSFICFQTCSAQRPSLLQKIPLQLENVSLSSWDQHAFTFKLQVQLHKSRLILPVGSTCFSFAIYKPSFSFGFFSSQTKCRNTPWSKPLYLTDINYQINDIFSDSNFRNTVLASSTKIWSCSIFLSSKIFTLTDQLTLLLCSHTKWQRSNYWKPTQTSSHKGRGRKKGGKAIRLCNLEAAFILSCDCRNSLEKNQADPCSLLGRCREWYTAGLVLV